MIIGNSAIDIAQVIRKRDNLHSYALTTIPDFCKPIIKILDNQVLHTIVQVNAMGVFSKAEIKEMYDINSRNSISQSGSLSSVYTVWEIIDSIDSNELFRRRFGSVPCTIRPELLHEGINKLLEAKGVKSYDCSGRKTP